MAIEPSEARSQFIMLLLDFRGSSKCDARGMDAANAGVAHTCSAVLLNFTATNRVAERFEVDVDLGFALFFVFILCSFLLFTIVRCARLVLDPYRSISVALYQEEEQTEE
ncbi:hypothetical protein DPEC_G00142790 [Dallia pectoralis]|uniref:Uncharacterized protein n=1 Tax=Dallia pectoralis TaxID=75939 RepID=A0ACC2GNP4_DALPE|nr:hypothetical protein DPEC_G00142790 [Dallia pectoralis]